jgi:hypothetical protein
LLRFALLIMPEFPGSRSFAKKSAKLGYMRLVFLVNIIYLIERLGV